MYHICIIHSCIIHTCIRIKDHRYIWCTYVCCMYLWSSILDPDACMCDAGMNDAYIHDPWPWCMYPWCGIFSGRTNERTNKAILGVGLNAFAFIFAGNRSDTGADVRWGEQCWGEAPAVNKMFLDLSFNWNRLNKLDTGWTQELMCDGVNSVGVRPHL